jgi:polyisoprenyl-teichoic acid--peptidoglycan teichoic acid transferase
VRFPIWARFLTAVLVIVGSVGTATAASLILYLNDLVPKPVPGLPPFPPAEPGGPQNILLLGSDRRNQELSGRYGLSDTTMLLRLDPDQHTISLLSLPRDLKVDIPGHGINKLNAAYSFGGPKLTLLTLKQLLGDRVPINHLVNLDFTGFARAVNEIGCVYADVDHRYFHRNTAGSEQYEEINLQPGYQALCGFDALDFARYRHTDTDLVRAARQQDLLREIRNQVPASRLLEDRSELVKIFTQETSSDIDSVQSLLGVLRLLIDLRDAPVRQVHFESTLGPSYVTASRDQLDASLRNFFGRAGERGHVSQSPARSAGEARRAVRSDLESTTYGRRLARGLVDREAELPVLYPTVLASGSDYAQKPRAYKVNGTGDGAPASGERAAYKWVFSLPGPGQYYGFEATRWADAPILQNPDDVRTIGGRTYDLFYDGGTLRLVAWEEDDVAYWLSNTLTESLTNQQMIAIARGMTGPRRAD